MFKCVRKGRNFVFLLLVWMFALSFFLPVQGSWAGSVQLDSETISHLEELGFSEDEIEGFTQERIEKLKNVKVTPVLESKKYYRITTIRQDNIGTQSLEKDPLVKMEEISEEQALREVREYNEKIEKKYESGVSPLNDMDDAVANDWITLHTIGRESSVYDEYYFKTYFEWLKSPTANYIDIIAMNVNENLVIQKNSEYFQYRYTIQERNPYNFQEIIRSTAVKPIVKYTADKRSSYCHAFKFNLYKPDLFETVDHLRGYMEFFADYEGSGRMAVSGSYSHGIKSYSGSIGISFPWGATLSVTPADSFINGPETYDSYRP